MTSAIRVEPLAADFRGAPFRIVVRTAGDPP